jgi:hypothetical protein
MTWAHRRRCAVGIIATVVGCVGIGACELQKITLVTSEDVVVAEVFVQLEEGGDGDVTVRAFLHRTLSTSGASGQVRGAHVTIVREDGSTLELAETVEGDCAETLPVDGDGNCYWAPPQPGRFQPGEHLQLEIGLADGGVLRSATTVPGGFSLVGIAPGTTCRLSPDTSMEVRWSRSGGAWAYVNETVLRGIGPALAGEGIDVEDDLYLLGLSVSAADTTIVFPGEFGVFNRFELDQDIALRLQRGLPVGVAADVTITATDRNYVNWVRGGNFNPSGQVRLPSVRGDGTGVFASAVVRRMQVAVGQDPTLGPDCPR